MRYYRGNIMNDVYNKQELIKIQRLELDVLKTIMDICAKVNIECFLIGGTALGSVRHKGFIPWDDDIDVGMTRENYKRFLNEAEKLLPNKYYLQTPYKGDNCPYFYSKLRLNGTEFVEYCNRNAEINHGIYVDIFPFDEVPDDERLNLKQFKKIQRLISIFALRQISDVSVYPVRIFEKLRCGIRHVLHKVIRIIPYKFLINKMEKEFTRYNGTRQSAIACLNFPIRKTEYIKVKELKPLKICTFENITVKIPNEFDAYLTRHYGDYMKMSPVEEQVGHKPWRVNLGEYDENSYDVGEI